MFYFLEEIEAMHIPQESLILLDAIDRRGSFAKAAEELDRATSAVSYGVQRLEDQLGITIFERQGRRSVLTPAGQLLLEEGRTILAATARLADRARELANGWETRIGIAIEATLDPSKCFEVLAAFHNDHPNIEIDVRETLLNGSWEALEHKRVDLLVGAVSPIPAHKGIRSEAIGNARLVPVISASHPQADAGDYEGVQRVANHDTVTTEIARSDGFDLSGGKTLYVQTMEQKYWAIRSGLGMGHLPQHLVVDDLKYGVLLQLNTPPSEPARFVAQNKSSKGKGLRELFNRLTKALH